MGKFTAEKEFTLTDEVKRRMIAVLGATAFSYALRNSEHLCRYIQSGTWYSLQMTGDTAFINTFRDALGQRLGIVNSPPEELVQTPVTSSAKIYPALRMPPCSLYSSV